MEAVAQDPLIALTEVARKAFHCVLTSGRITDLAGLPLDSIVVSSIGDQSRPQVLRGLAPVLCRTVPDESGKVYKGNIEVRDGSREMLVVVWIQEERGAISRKMFSAIVTDDGVRFV